MPSNPGTACRIGDVNVLLYRIQKDCGTGRDHGGGEASEEEDSHGDGSMPGSSLLDIGTGRPPRPHPQRNSDAPAGDFLRHDLGTGK